MQMPESYRIEGDKLTIIVGEAEFEFAEKKDFIRSDSEKILMKHHAITVLAQNANIYVSMPVLLTSHDSNCFVIAREARKEDGTKYSAVGESNPKNLWSEYLEQYPAETADNRAYDRAVLGVIGVYGKIYSTSEFSFNDGKPQKESKPTVITSIAAVEEAKEETVPENNLEEAADQIGKLPEWWNDIGVGVYSDKQLDPTTFIVTEGQCKGKNWTVKQLYEFKYDSCYYFATRTLENSKSEEFTKQVYACRRALRQYGIKPQEKSA